MCHPVNSFHLVLQDTQGDGLRGRRNQNISRVGSGLPNHEMSNPAYPAKSSNVIVLFYDTGLRRVIIFVKHNI